MARIASARYSVGQASQQDVIKINLEAAMLNNDLITFGAEKDIAATRLKAILSRDQDSAIAGPADIPREKVEVDAAMLMNAALKNNPDIRMSEFEAEAGAASADLAKKNYYPDFMVGFAPIQRDNRFDSFDLMFQVNIPLWRGKYDSLSEEASSNLEAARFRAL
ncbi:MAG: TolC family protein [Deltaproteobacteria bacterium]|nr:TolC family protein [Deltaproteobacteria bacterium]